MTKAAHTAVNPLRERGDAAVAGVMLGKAMTMLEQATADAPTHRAAGDLLRMSD